MIFKFLTLVLAELNLTYANLKRSKCRFFIVGGFFFK